MAQTNLKVNQDYKIEKTSPQGDDILVGQVDDQILEETSWTQWYAEGKQAYEPDSAAMTVVRKYLPYYDIVSFLGTWCGDSHYLFPKFMKVIDEAGYDPEKLKIYAVDRAKNALNVEHKLYRIERVPTIIFYRNNNEIQRIIESIDEPIEVWMAKFLEYEEDLNTED